MPKPVGVCVGDSDNLKGHCQWTCSEAHSPARSLGGSRSLRSPQRRNRPHELSQGGGLPVRRGVGSVRTDQPAAGCRGARRPHDTRAASRVRGRRPSMPTGKGPGMTGPDLRGREPQVRLLTGGACAYGQAGGRGALARRVTHSGLYSEGRKAPRPGRRWGAPGNSAWVLDRAAIPVKPPARCRVGEARSLLRT